MEARREGKPRARGRTVRGRVSPWTKIVATRYGLHPIQAAALAKGWQIAEMAAKAEVDRTNLYRLMRRKAAISDDVAERLAAATGFSPDYFRGPDVMLIIAKPRRWR